AVVKVGHGAHVDPGLRHGDNNIGKAKSKPGDQDDAVLGLRDHLADQILAGNAEMHGALAELARDLRCRQISDLDLLEAVNRAALVARPAGLDESKPGGGKEGFGFLLHPPLGRDGKNERLVPGAPPAAASSSTEAANPTAGIASRAPSRAN